MLLSQKYKIWGVVEMKQKISYALSTASLLLCSGCSMDAWDTALSGMNAVGSAMFEEDATFSGTGNSREAALESLYANATNAGFSIHEVDPGRMYCSNNITYWQCEGTVRGMWTGY